MSKSKRGRSSSKSRKKQPLVETIDITLHLETTDAKVAQTIKSKHESAYVRKGWDVSVTLHRNVKKYILKIKGEKKLLSEVA